MSKALEAAVKAIRDYHDGEADECDEAHARLAITAFLDAAAGDRDLCEALWDAAYDEWAEFGSLDHDGGKAAILALKEAVNG
jgi:hypothetical protein